MRHVEPRVIHVCIAEVTAIVVHRDWWGAEHKGPQAKGCDYLCPREGGVQQEGSESVSAPLRGVP